MMDYRAADALLRAARRSAQYFFIRRDTAFRSAAVIGLRRPRGRPVLNDTVAARAFERRSGKIRNSAARSSSNAFKRASAPTRASRRNSSAPIPVIPR